MTYKEVGDRCKNFASGLRTLAAERKFVGICGINRVEWFVADWACIMGVRNHTNTKQHFSHVSKGIRICSHSHWLWRERNNLCQQYKSGAAGCGEKLAQQVPRSVSQNSLFEMHHLHGRNGGIREGSDFRATCSSAVDNERSGGNWTTSFGWGRI